MKTRILPKKSERKKWKISINACFSWFGNAVVNSAFYIPRMFEKHIVVNAWVKVRRGKLVHQNWGDDICVYLVELLTGKKVIVRNCSLLHMILPLKNYILIGSVAGFYENRHTIMWGTGLISPQGRPKKGAVAPRNRVKNNRHICSVRGMKTRELLLGKGLDCPAVFGDPALLLSKIYNPRIEKRYKMGIVPHYVDLNNEAVKDFLANHPETLLIDLTRYDKWTDVIDKILSCEVIVSSSLHGLIVSDSYGIPNIWVSLSNRIVGGTFKFLDYFSSVNREEKLPYLVRQEEDLEKIYAIAGYSSFNAVVDFDSIMNSCPLPITNWKK